MRDPAGCPVVMATELGIHCCHSYLGDGATTYILNKVVIVTSVIGQLVHHMSTVTTNYSNNLIIHIHSSLLCTRYLFQKKKSMIVYIQIKSVYIYEYIQTYMNTNIYSK